MTPPEDQTFWQWIYAGILTLLGLVYKNKSDKLDEVTKRLDSHIRSSNETYVTRDELASVKELLLEILRNVRKER